MENGIVGIRLPEFSTLSYGPHTYSLLKTHAIIRSLRMEGVVFLQFVVHLLVALHRTYSQHFQHTEIELFQIKDIIVGVRIKMCSPLLNIFF